MATPLSADRLLSALRAEGVRVREYKSWRHHNRNHKGRWGGVNGIVIHHTAGRNSLRLCYEGTADLPGPLCHSHLDKAGVVTMVGHGRANHAGTFAANAHDAVVSERSTHPRPDASEPIDGNRHYYGIEVENLGNGSDWYPSVQYDAAVRWAAAICRAHGWNAQSVIGHKEGTRRKIDPRGPVGRPDGPAFDMDRFRADVQRRLDRAPDTDTAPAPAPKEDATVPDYLSLGMTRPVTDLAPGTWISPLWDTTWEDSAGLHADGARAIGPGFSYVGFVHVRLSGLTLGHEVQVRVAEDTLDGREKGTFPIGEGVGTAGDTFLTMPITGKCHGNERIRVEVAHFGDAPVTLDRAEIKAQVWKH